MPIIGRDACERKAAAVRNEKDSTTSDQKIVMLKDDADEIVGVMLGDPVGREVYWDDNINSLVDVEAKPAPPGVRTRIRFLWNVYVITSDIAHLRKGGEVMPENITKVLEMSADCFDSVTQADKEYGLTKTVVTIRRSGRKGSTDTKFLVLYKRRIEEMEGLAEAIEIAYQHPLLDIIDELNEGVVSKFKLTNEPNKRGSGGGQRSGQHGQAAPRQAAPRPATTTASRGASSPAGAAPRGAIAETTRQELFSRLKPLGREKAMEVLARVKRPRFDHITTDQMPEVLRIITEMEAAAGIETDAFAPRDDIPFS